jgi:hypothetical protein
VIILRLLGESSNILGRSEKAAAERDEELAASCAAACSLSAAGATAADAGISGDPSLYRRRLEAREYPVYASWAGCEPGTRKKTYPGDGRRQARRPGEPRRRTGCRFGFLKNTP